MTGPRIDPDREEYEREKALFEQYQREKAQAAAAKPEPVAAPPEESGLKKLARGAVMLMGVATPAGMARAAANPEARGLVLSGLQGASMGGADEIGGALAGLSKKAGGGSFREGYASGRDAIRGEEESFRSDHPIASMASNVAGGLIGGAGLARLATNAVPALGKVAFGNVMTTGGRALDAGVKGAIAGGASAAASAKPGERMAAILPGAAMGAAGGAVFSGALDGAKGLARLARPAVERMGLVKPADAMESGGRRVLSALSRQGKKTDDLAAWNATADAADVLGEGVGDQGISLLTTTVAAGNKAPEMVRKGLEKRARNAVARVRDDLTREVGESVDDQAFIASKKLQAQTESKPLFDASVSGRTVTDPRVIDLLGRPMSRGAFDDAVRLAADDGVQLPTSAQVLGKAKGPRTAPDVDLPAPTKSNAMDEADIYDLPTDELDKLRRKAGSIDKLTDRELDVEMEYLRRVQKQDEMRLMMESDPDFIEYQELRSVGMQEDARGALENVMLKFGYDGDPATFSKVLADAGSARKNIDGRAAKIAAVEKEMQRRNAKFGEMPDDAATEAATSIPSRSALTVPDAGEAATLPTVDARHIQYWKFALDKKIAELEVKPGAAASTQLSQAIKQRNAVEDLLFEHTEGWSKAQQTYAKPMQEADAFAQGQRGGRTIKTADVPRLLADKNAPFLSKGVSNTLLEDLEKVRNGDVGRIQNPTPLLTGSDAADARLTVATGNDAGKLERLRRTAGAVDRQFKTAETVLAGSPTAKRSLAIADQMGPMFNAGQAVNAVRNPLLAALDWGAGKMNAARRSMVGNELDAAAELLMAGAPGAKMTRGAALQLLQRMEPEVRNRYLLQSSGTGFLGGMVAGPAVR